jgi:hypothetical protein
MYATWVGASAARQIAEQDHLWPTVGPSVWESIAVAAVLAAAAVTVVALRRWPGAAVLAILLAQLAFAVAHIIGPSWGPVSPGEVQSVVQHARLGGVASGPDVGYLWLPDAMRFLELVVQLSMLGALSAAALAIASARRASARTVSADPAPASTAQVPPAN